MTITNKLLISALALVLAAQVNAAPILVGEFTAKSGDDKEHVAIREAINTYNGSHDPDLSQLFGTGTSPLLINDWNDFVSKTTDIDGYDSADGKTLNFTAPGTYAEYYVFSKYGSGGADFNMALHYLSAGDVLSYNPGGASAPNGLSHIAIWARGTPTNVPDSGLTLALFGAGLMMLGVMKRRMRS
jgi:hypothetical protein